jgi:hypothetical protein
MEVVIGGRQCGKTTRARQWLMASDNRVMLVYSEMRRDQTIRELVRYGLDKELAERQVRTVQDVASLRGSQAEIGIDDLDMCLATLVGRMVTYATVTGTVEELAPYPPSVPQTTP